MNPIICRLTRGQYSEVEHRGAWALVNTAGDVLQNAGDAEQAVFARSSSKPIQALPLVTSGAAEAFKLSSAELAIAMASHSAEETHLATVRSLLEKIGCTEADLQCGPVRSPGAGKNVTALAINSDCSGKHAGFLATAVHLGDDVANYLDPASKLQTMIYDATLEMSGVMPDKIQIATDGCSAPTFRLSMRGLATAIARWSNPDSLEEHKAGPIRVLNEAMATHPRLIASSGPAIDADLIEVTDGRLLCKIGALGILAIGIAGSNAALVIKVEDGAKHGLYKPTIRILDSLGLLSASELEKLQHFDKDERTNAADITVGKIEVPKEVLPKLSL